MLFHVWILMMIRGIIVVVCSKLSACKGFILRSHVMTWLCHVYTCLCVHVCVHICVCMFSDQVHRSPGSFARGAEDTVPERVQGWTFGVRKSIIPYFFPVIHSFVYCAVVTPALPQSRRTRVPPHHHLNNSSCVCMCVS